MSDPHHTPGFFEKKSTINALIALVVAICAGFGAAEFFIHRHGHFGEDHIPLFYGLAGFAAFFGLVLLGKQLRKLIMRDEDYYDRD